MVRAVVWKAVSGKINPVVPFVPYANPSGNLVVNGGFELGLDHWTKTNDDSDLGRRTSLKRHSGYYAIGAGAQLPIYFSQDLNTVPGQIYAVEFWLCNDDDGDDGDKYFEIYMNGLQIENNTIANLPPNIFYPFRFLYTADQDVTELTISTANNEGYYFFDDFSVVALAA